MSDTAPAVDMPSRAATQRDDSVVWDQTQDGRRLPAPIDQFGAYRLQKISFLLCVVLPTLLVGVYYALVAADQYSTEFRFGIRTPAAPILQDDIVSLVMRGLGTESVGREPYMAASYMRSRNIVSELDHGGWLREVFASPRADWLARFDPSESEEELWRYWQNRITVSVDRISGLVTVRTIAFRPEDSLEIAWRVGAATERMVDRMSDRARQEALADAAADLERATERHAQALRDLRRVRDEERVLDPEKNIEGLLTERIGVLREKLTLERERAVMGQRLAPQAPQLKALSEQIVALDEQLGRLDARLTSRTQSQRTAAAAISRFEAAETERIFSERLLEFSKQSYERARLEAERRHLYFITFVEPKAPDTAEFPRRLRATVAVSLVCFVIWGITMLIVAGVRDQRLTS